MEIWLLGSLEVRDDRGAPLVLSGTRLRALLSVLALRCGEVVTDDQLVDGLWGGDAPSRSLNALQRQVSSLRRALGGADSVRRHGVGYVLALDKSEIDIFRFDELAARGHAAMRDGDISRARDLLDDALRLWRGEALADVAYEQFAQQDIARLTEARLLATEARIDADLALGREAGLIGELEQLVLAYPLREHLRAQLMLALSRSGRQAEALRTYQSARAVLGEELGLEPSAELRELEAAILQQDEAVVRRDVEDPRPSSRTNLHAPLASLIGRGVDLDELRPLLHAQRLVTLVGPGGVGKSRLAIEAAREWLASGGIDVWLVELAEVSDPDEVVPATMAALDVARTGSAAADSRQLIEALREREALVVLDNCEHLVAAAARVAQDLLGSCPSLRIWATSREGLALPGEVLWPVAPLALPDAVALFVERGRAADPTAGLDTDSARTRGTLEAICQRLDGLPLAIELAAARLRAMPVTELAAGLEDRFRVLNRGARTALPRQQTLRAVVDWSYDLLFDDERRVFDRLSVFGGSCTLVAARAVCADDEISADDVAELVSRLADKSLVRVESDDLEGYARCHMLQTLVDYGRDRLEVSGDAPRVFAAHARYYADFARRSQSALLGNRQAGWMRAVTTNLGNLRSVFDAALDEADAETAQGIAGSLGWYWWFTGRAIEGAQWLGAARECSGAVQELTGARVAAWTAFTSTPGFVRWTEPDASSADDARGARRLLDAEMDGLVDEARAGYSQAGVGAAGELAGVEMALSISYSTRGDYARAAELLADAERRLAAVESEPAAAAMRTYAAGRRAFLENRYADAEQAVLVAVDALAACGAEVYCTFALRHAGRLAALRGDYAASIAAIERALEAARRLGVSGFANLLMADLGDALGAGGDFARAREVLHRPLRAARDVGYLPGVCDSLAALALLELRAGELGPAGQLAREALDIAEVVGDNEAAANCLVVLGIVAARRGDDREARARHHSGLDLARRSSDTRSVALALRGLADVTLRDDPRAAARLLGAAAALRESPGRAAGTAYAVRAGIDADELLAAAGRAVGVDGAAESFAAGAADPQRVVAELTR